MGLRGEDGEQRKVVSGTWGTSVVNLWKYFNILIPDKNVPLCGH